MSKSNKAIVIREGLLCPKCKQVMERRKHPDHYIHRKSFYFIEWDFCKNCKHVQHYDEFKSDEWRELEERENFIQNI